MNSNEAMKIMEDANIVERLKKRIEELDEYIQDQFDNHNNIAGIEEDTLEELQKILGEKK